MDTEPLPNNEQISITELRNNWIDKERQKDLDEALADVNTITAVGSVLYEFSAHKMNGMVCGFDGMGEFQVVAWDRLKPILESWNGLDYPKGSEEGAEQYRRQSTLLEEFPGDSTRRKLDNILRHYCGVV